MLPAILTFVATPQVKTWYGPAVATFAVEFGGNPYDPAENDVRVKFLGPKGEPLERIAYYDDAENVWRAVLVTEEPGKYKATLFRNGVAKLEEPAEGLLEVEAPLKGGFIRRDPILANRFRRDDGSAYVPVGFNLGWQDGAILPITEQIAKASKAGVNWSRIWACHWDGKNPWWPQNDAQAPLAELWGPALTKWEAIVDTCEANGVPFQMVLFHHGAFSSRVNPNWPEHPWNAKNKGFLKDAADFFTDEEAKRRAKLWLRYAVARWGHSPAVMSWELFNEVEWVDARYANRWPDIERWHGEMADYLRSIDPYGHLITTSSAMDRPELWAKMDYVQPHVYSPGVFGAVLGATLPKEKPGFFGEFGADDMGKADARRVLRDGLLGGLFGNHAGAGQFWYWDFVEKQNLYSEFTHAATVLAKSEYAAHPTARPIALRADTEGRADLVLQPGGGWEKATKSSFLLPEEATPANLRGVPSYLQGQTGENRAMFEGGLTLRFRADRAGTIRLRLNQVSKNGGRAVITVDGREAASRDFPAGDAEKALTDVLEAPFGVGEHTVVVSNPGRDWVKMASVEVTGVGPQAQAVGLADAGWAMVRVTAAKGATSPSATLVGLPFGNGTVRVTTVDLDSGAVSESSGTISGGKLTVPLRGDTVLVLRV